jgi:hypothetical protein
VQKKNKDRRILIVFEFPDEVASFLRTHGEEYFRKEGVSILALMPATEATLRRIGFTCFNTLPFFDQKGHENALLASDRILKTIGQDLVIKDDYGIKEGYQKAFMYYLRFFVHYLLFNTEVLYKAVAILRPNKLMTPRQKTPGLRKVQISYGERHIGKIAQLYCRKCGLDFESFPQSSISERRIAFGRLGVNLARRVVFSLNLFLYRNLFRKKKLVLSLSQDYNLPRVVKGFQVAHKDVVSVYLHSKNYMIDLKRMILMKSFWSFISLPSYVSHRAIGCFKNDLEKKSKALVELFTVKQFIARHKDVDLSQFIIQFVKDTFVSFLTELYGRTVNLDKILSSLPTCLVLSQYALGLGHNLGELCRQKSVPAVLISHGSHVPPKNIFEQIEWREHGNGLMNTDYQYLSIQTPWSASYLKHNTTRSTTLKTGPLLFATKYRRDVDKMELRRNLLPNVRENTVILHASTPKTRQSIRFYVYETPDEYINNINALIKNVERLKDVYLVVRFRASPELSIDDLRTLLLPSNCYGIHAEGCFDDFLLMADLLVSYSSTTIEEALHNRVPVLQYDPHGKYCHIPCQKLTRGKKPIADVCYFVGEEDDLNWALSWIVENHLQHVEPPDLSWRQHSFTDDETEDLVKYFSDIFRDSHI